MQVQVNKQGQFCNDRTAKTLTQWMIQESLVPLSWHGPREKTAPGQEKDLLSRTQTTTPKAVSKRTTASDPQDDPEVPQGDAGPTEMPPRMTAKEWQEYGARMEIGEPAFKGAFSKVRCIPVSLPFSPVILLRRSNQPSTPLFNHLCHFIELRRVPLRCLLLSARYMCLQKGLVSEEAAAVLGKGSQ
jgi:hypothetical protein